MPRRTATVSTLAVAAAVLAGLVAPSAASAAPTPAPCPTDRICVYGGANGELLAARTLTGWKGTWVSVVTSKIVNNTSTPIAVTLSRFDDFEGWYLAQATSYDVRVGARGSASVDSLDARNIRAAR